MKNLIRKILREETVDDKPTVIFIAGCSSEGKCNKKYKYSPEQQGGLLKSGLGGDFNVQTFSWSPKNSNPAITAISKYNDPYVVMFSQGCIHSKSVFDEMKSKDLNKVYIVEPPTKGYLASEIQSITSTSNKDGNISVGVPKKNIFGGTSSGTGKNVAGTPREGKDHWSAIGSVGKSIKNSYVAPAEEKEEIFNDPNRYSDTLHPDNYRLNEQEEDKELDPFDDTLFPSRFMEKMMVKMDEDPDFFLKEILPSMSFSNKQETNTIYNYLTRYDRKDYYIPVNFDAEELSDLFYDDRDYDIQEMAKKYFEQDYNYFDDYHYDCYDYDTHYFNMVDKVNIDVMREKYLDTFGGDKNEVYSKEGFMEFVEEEFGGDIGCSMSDAQQSADVDALHTDFKNSVEDYLSEFNGKLENPILDDKTGARGYSLEFNGSREVGDMVDSEMFKDTLYDHVNSGYSTLSEIFLDIFYLEKNDENYYTDNVLLPEEKIQINSDKHFRYGGAGDVDSSYFNEILHDRLMWD
jgi:hypothetical protein